MIRDRLDHINHAPKITPESLFSSCPLEGPGQVRAFPAAATAQLPPLSLPSTGPCHDAFLFHLEAVPYMLLIWCNMFWAPAQLHEPWEMAELRCSASLNPHPNYSNECPQQGLEAAGAVRGWRAPAVHGEQTRLLSLNTDRTETQFTDTESS